MSTAWTSRYAQRIKHVHSSAIRELLKITQNPQIISFAGGLPAPDVFPVERFREACSKVLATQAKVALQYGATEGYEPLARNDCAPHLPLRDKGKAGACDDHVGLAAGARPDRKAVDQLRRPRAGRGSHISGSAAGVQCLWRGISLRAQ